MLSVLIVGSGGREHALIWKLSQSPDIDRLYVAPGNAGTAMLAENIPISATDVPALVRFAVERDVGLTVIGPEAPLALGLADALRARGRSVVGPGAGAARIESSKSFAKSLMRRAGVPTAAYRVFDRADDALAYAARVQYPLVVKADGLAAGKGVAICRDLEEAHSVIRAFMIDRVHGAAGQRIVLEEALTGPEVSLLAFVDGERVFPLPLAQDHKRLCDGDRGPNTGGMGAYAPYPFLSQSERDRLVEITMQPVVERLAAMDMPYRGVLFAGLMLTPDGPSVLEFNCRLGDPEAQVVLPLLDGDLLPWLEGVAMQRLEGPAPTFAGGAAGVVLAAPGYPEAPLTGAPIEGLDGLPSGVIAFHAGTALNTEGQVVTAGGRVLTVVGIGIDIGQAVRCAYAAPIHFEGMQRRSDIAWQARATSVDVAAKAHLDTPSSVAPLDPRPLHFSINPYGSRIPRIAVLASGEGTNLQALVDACATGELDAEICLVVSHNPEAPALDRALAAGIPALTIPVRDRRDPRVREELEYYLLRVVREHDPDIIVLAGWMLILSSEFLEHCPAPVINVHPALLAPAEPAMPVLRGIHAVRDALALGLPYTGVSVHIVTAEVDAGPVLIDARVPIETGDTERSLYARIKPVEHRLLIEAVRMTVLTHPHTGGAHARHVS